MVFALPAMAGTALVQAMGTDNWRRVQRKAVQLFKCGKPVPRIRQELDAIHQQLATAPAQMQANWAAQWQTRFDELLAAHPETETELIALVEKVVEDLKPVDASAATAAQAIPDDGSAWQTEMQTFIVGRYDRVQTAAQTWLTIMTTLFGVFSTVVVVGGPPTFKDIHGPPLWRILVLAGAAVVFLLAFLATMYGLFASWGGLGAALIRAEESNSLNRTEPNNRVRRMLTHIRWGLTDIWRELKDMWWPDPLERSDVKNAKWQNFYDNTRDRANRNRERLHRSRVLGVAAVTCTGGLAFFLILNSFFFR